MKKTVLVSFSLALGMATAMTAVAGEKAIPANQAQKAGIKKETLVTAGGK